MRTPTQVLQEEHRVILRALDVLETATTRLAAGASIPEGWWGDLCRWLRAFADRTHHAKEEQALFPAMVKAGVPSAAGGPIAVMLEEHAEGRALVQAMEAAGPTAGTAPAREYVELLRQHIAKENEVVFPLADAVLEEPAQQALRREFEGVETALGPAAAIDVAEAEVARLESALRPD